MMFTNYQECVNTIMSRKNRTYGNENLKKALVFFNNPHLKLKTLHVAGTNGKGSTTNYLYNILHDAGYKVGTFTSPHLIEHRDRIRLNNQNISEEDFITYAHKTYELWETYDLSMFDIDFMISSLYFLDNNIDYAIYEVGLGGLLDSTNVIDPMGTLITNISLDHTQILGNTLEEIAVQKAGILKDPTPLFTTVQNEELLQIFKERTSKVYEINIPAYSIEKGHVTYTINNEIVDLGKQAVYQVANSYLAYETCRHLFPNITSASIIKSIEKAHWAGRFEEILPNIYLDGAHNVAGIHALIDSLPLLKRPITLVFAALKDKPYQEMIELLKPHVDTLILTTFDFERTYDLESIPVDSSIYIEPHYKVAIESAKNTSETVVISGSLYFISTIRAYLLDSI